MGCRWVCGLWVGCWELGYAQSMEPDAPALARLQAFSGGSQSAAPTCGNNLWWALELRSVVALGLAVEPGKVCVSVLARLNGL